MSIMETMMLRMGIDPKAIEAQIQTAGKGFQDTVSHFNRRLDDIERNQQKIMIALDIPVIAKGAII